MLLDPSRGRRRRALIRDKATSLMHHSQDALGKVSRDAKNRARGIAAEAKHMMHREDNADDSVLEARVRSKLGRAASHPGAITVVADKGRVTLSGPILSDEVDSLTSVVSKVPGVREIEDQLEVHEYPDIPSLQGGRPRAERAEWRQSTWSPSTRFMSIAWGAGMVTFALKRRDAIGAAAGATGAYCLIRGITNHPISEMLPDVGEEEDYYLVSEDIELTR
jgi:hypothetical protein